MTADWIAFIGLAAVAVITGIMMIASRNTIYSALYLVLNFATIAVFYLLLNAPFIAMVQVTVYAGAIMVLFLFVIMLLGVERVETSQTLPYQGPAAIVLGVVLLVLLGYSLTLQPNGIAGALEMISEGFGSPADVGELLFNEYLIPFEVVSVLLLVAMIGAILLTERRRKEGAMSVPTSALIGLSAVLFTLGVLGVLVRRNALVIFMSIELMLNAGNLAFIAFARASQALSGQVFVFFVIAVAAAEVAVGLALIVAIFRARHTIDVDQVKSLHG